MSFRSGARVFARADIAPWPAVRAYRSGVLVREFIYEPGNAVGAFRESLAKGSDIDTLVLEGVDKDKHYRFVLPVAPTLVFQVDLINGGPNGYQNVAIDVPVPCDLVGPANPLVRFKATLTAAALDVRISSSVTRDGNAPKPAPPQTSLKNLADSGQRWGISGLPFATPITTLEAALHVNPQTLGVSSAATWLTFRFVEVARGSDSVVHVFSSQRWGRFVPSGGTPGDSWARALVDPLQTTPDKALSQRPGFVVYNAALVPLADRPKLRVMMIQLGATGADPVDVRPLIGAVGITDADVRRFWNEDVAIPYMRSIATTRGGNRASLLPTFDNTNSVGQRWGVLAERAKTARLVAAWPATQVGSQKLVMTGARTTTGDHPTATASVAPVGIYDPVGTPVTPLDGTSFSYAAGQDPTFDYDIAYRAVTTAGLAIEERALIAFDLRELTPAQASVRSGALDLRIAANAVSTDPNVNKRLGGRVRGVLSAGNDLAERNPIFIDLLLTIPIDQVSPGGEDAAPGELRADTESALVTASPEERALDEQVESLLGRDAAIVIPWKPGVVRSLVWQVAEATRGLRGHAIEQAIRNLPVAGNAAQLDAKDRTIVLDRDPFLVAVVSYPALRPQNQANEATFAVWDDLASVWRIEADRDQQFNLVLPPQAVGEAMAKGHNLDAVANQPLDYRLSPPARFTLRASILDRRYVTAPWNLRTILGNSGDETPGAFVESIEFELLYGLSCRADHPFLRLAEITSRVGALANRVPRHRAPTLADDLLTHPIAMKRPAGAWTPPAPVDPAINLTLLRDRAKDLQATWDKYRVEWGTVAARYRTHLALLEPWSEANRTILPTIATSCTIRDADMKPPVPELLTDPATAPTQIQQAAQEQARALEGGVLWGLESAAIYRAIVRRPQSTSATLAEAGFSALGGFGFQKASFDNDLSTIYAHASMGRTYDYTVERIGRIGVFWNLAKHVIVYQRTVAPTEQYKGGIQTPLLGRPILRKVAEYVEILQPTRKYPEFGEAPAVRGFVTACSFPPGTRIHVDSSWGNDIGDEGWQVPLYNPAAEAANPNVYRKPAVLLATRSQRDGKPVDVLSPIDNPELLVFYTRTVPGTTRNTDEWPSVLGVDYAATQVGDPQGDYAPNATSTGADPIGPAPGMERFSYRISVPEAVDIVADRTDRAIRAAIDTVSMMRPPAQVDLERLAQSVPQARAARDDIVGVATSAQDALGKLATGLSDRARALRLSAEHDANDAVLAGTEVLDVVTKWQGDAAAAISKARNAANAAKTSVANEISATGAAVQAFATRSQNRLGEIIGDGTAQATRYGAYWTRVADEVRALQQEGIAHGWWSDATKRAAELTAFRDEHVLADFKRIGITPDPLRRILVLSRDALANMSARRAEIDAALAAVMAAQAPVAARKALDDLDQRVTAAIAPAVDMLRKLRDPDNPTPSILIDSAIEPFLGALETARQIMTAAVTLGATQLPPTWGNARQILATAESALLDEAKRFADLASGQAPAFVTDAGKLIAAQIGIDIAAKKLRDVWDTEVIAAAGPGLANLDAALTDLASNATKRSAELAALQTDLTTQAKAIANDIWGVGIGSRQIAKSLSDAAIDARIGAAEAVRAALASFGSFPDLHNISAATKQFSAAAQTLGAEINRQADTARARIEGAMRQYVDELHGHADKTLKLVQALGKPPELPNLDFGRERIEYVFRGVSDAVRITPVAAAVNQGLATLQDPVKALGLRVPTRELLDRCIPADLQNFKISDVFPDFAGLPLRGMFSGVTLPPEATRNVIVQHGEDLQRQRAWVEAEVKPFQFAPGTLFNIGPLLVTLPSAEFTAFMRASVGLSGQNERVTRARIRGDWALVLGGQQLLVIRDTAVDFTESGRLKFALDPRNVELSGAMAFVSDLLKSLTSGTSGLTISLLPNGVQSLLELPLPDMGGGAFSIANLRLGARFALTFEKDGVTVTAGVSLARKEAPFALTVFILGGSGYIDVYARYPIGGRIGCHAEVGISANARAAISLGPISGGVGIYLGIAISFAQDGSAASGVHFGVNILIEGHVSILGIVDAGIWLLLELIYGDGALIGRGTFHCHIKICWCFTLSVNRSVEYRLACDAIAHNGMMPTRTPLPAADIDRLAKQYIAMLA